MILSVSNAEQMYLRLSKDIFKRLPLPPIETWGKQQELKQTNYTIMSN